MTYEGSRGSKFHPTHLCVYSCIEMDIHFYWRNKEPFSVDDNGYLYKKVRQTSARIAIGESRSNQADGLDDLHTFFS